MLSLFPKIIIYKTKFDIIVIFFIFHVERGNKSCKKISSVLFQAVKKGAGGDGLCPDTSCRHVIEAWKVKPLNKNVFLPITFYAFLGIFKAFLKILHKIWKNLIFLPEISYFMT